MAEELIRKTNLLGNNKVIVGNGQTDVVLDTLGKVYIKTGNNLKVLTDIISQISKLSKNKSDLEVLSKVLIVNNIEKIDYPGDGILIFDLSLNSLYISYDGRYILIINLVDKLQNLDNPEKPQISSEYVKKSGDTMTGALSITTATAPLIIASKQLIYNLNALFLNGHTSYEFAQKAIDEYITGHWAFNNVDVNKTLKVKDKAVISNIIGTEQFSGGYLGTGWRIDSNTNTMVIDNLMVRKTMRVFELIVNLIRATNGSVWVTDTCKVKNVFDIQLLNLDDETSEILDNIWYIPYSSTKSFNYSLKTIDGSHLANYLGLGVTTKYHTFGFIVKCSNNFFNFQTLKEFLLNLKSDYDKNNIDIVCIFDEHSDKSKSPSLNIILNSIISTYTTPRFYSMKNEALLPKNEILEIYTYYKYFGTTNLSTEYIKVVEADHEKYPTLREGDIIRCLKFKDNNIKYYDALVASSFNSYFYIIIVAPSVFDKYKDDTVNVNYYSQSNQTNIQGATLEESKAKILKNPEVILDNILAKDEVVRIGSISDPNRQGSVYLSSSEEDSPVIRVLNGVNKPDFSVAYRYPLFLTKRPEGKGPKKYYKVEGNSYTYYDTPNLDCIMATENGLVKSVYNNHIRTQLGNLQSIENDAFGDDLPEGYGLYGENVYLTGTFILASTGETIEHSVKTNFDALAEGITEDIININKRLDGKVLVHYVKGDPNIYDHNPANPNNLPEGTIWIDKEHIGDMCYDEVNHKSYRYLKTDLGDYKWEEVTDPSLKLALEQSAKALAAADGKCQIFLKTPDAQHYNSELPEYRPGDMWVNANYSIDGKVIFKNELAVCEISNVTAEGEILAFNINHWKKACDYLDIRVIENLADDSVITPFEKKTLLLFRTNMESAYSVLSKLWADYPNISDSLENEDTVITPLPAEIFNSYTESYTGIKNLLRPILDEESLTENHVLSALEVNTYKIIFNNYETAKKKVEQALNTLDTLVFTNFSNLFKVTEEKFINQQNVNTGFHDLISTILATADNILLTVEDTYKFEEIGNAYGTACDVFFQINNLRVDADIVKDSNKISCTVPSNFNSSESNNLHINLPYRELPDWESDIYTIAFNLQSLNFQEGDFYVIMGTFITTDNDAANFGGGFYHNKRNERIQIRIQKPEALQGKSAQLINFWFHQLKPNSTYIISNIVLEKGKIDHPLIWRPSLYDLKLNQKLLATGIDIKNQHITLTADTVKILDNNGNTAALFEDGRIKGKYLDISEATVKEKLDVGEGNLVINYDGSVSMAGDIVAGEKNKSRIELLSGKEIPGTLVTFDVNKPKGTGITSKLTNYTAISEKFLGRQGLKFWGNWEGVFEQGTTLYLTLIEYNLAGNRTNSDRVLDTLDVSNKVLIFKESPYLQTDRIYQLAIAGTSPGIVKHYSYTIHNFDVYTSEGAKPKTYPSLSIYNDSNQLVTRFDSQPLNSTYNLLSTNLFIFLTRGGTGLEALTGSSGSSLQLGTVPANREFYNKNLTLSNAVFHKSGIHLTLNYEITLSSNSVNSSYFVVETYSNSDLSASSLIATTKFLGFKSSIKSIQEGVDIHTAGYSVIKLHVCNLNQFNALSMVWNIKSHFYSDINTVNHYFGKGWAISNTYSNKIKAERIDTGELQFSVNNDKYGFLCVNEGAQYRFNLGPRPKWINYPVLLYRCFSSFKDDYKPFKLYSFNLELPLINKESRGLITFTFPSTWKDLNLTPFNTEIRAIGVDQTSVYGDKYKLGCPNIKVSVNNFTDSFLTIALADDASTNDGNFTLSIYYLPNIES